MSIRRIHPYVETDDLAAARSFYTDVFGLRVVMEEPVLGLSAPELESAQIIVCPRGFETPQPDFGIDLGAPELSFRTSRALFLPPPFGLFGGSDCERFEFACECV